MSRFLPIAGLALVLSACAGGREPPMRLPPPVPIRMVTADGAVESLRVNEPIEVRLSFRAEAGEEWVLETAPDEAMVRRHNLYRQSPQTKGGPTTQVWQLMGAGPGETTASFILKRPGAAEPAQRVRITFRVG